VTCCEHDEKIVPAVISVILRDQIVDLSVDEDHCLFQPADKRDVRRWVGIHMSCQRMSFDELALQVESLMQ